MAGIIEAIADHGSVVVVFVRGDEGNDHIHCDRRMFAAIYECEGGHLIGREVEVHGDLGEQSIEFLD